MNQLERLMNSLPQGIDAALVSSHQNRRYLTGFASSAGTLLILREHAYFIIDSRYIEVARERVKGCEVILQDKLYNQIRELCASHSANTLAVENSYITLTEFCELRDTLAPLAISESPELDAAILRQRRYKTPDEVAHMREAQRLTDETFTHILNFIRPGKTEREIALEMEFFLRRAGADGISFDFIVASGANSSRPHAVPGMRAVCEGDFITMDFGADVAGYFSDMTRTVAVGPEAKILPEQRRVYDTVLQAQLAALDAIRIGKACSEIDGVARSLIDSAGYKGCFGHGLGHSVGVEIHEKPAFSMASKDIVEPGMIMTVEPGVYLEGRFGCRIEDMVYITENGTQNLTASPKELLVL